MPRNEDTRCSLQGVRALITGASRGLGFALARSLGNRGAKVALVAREAVALQHAVTQLQREGIPAFAFPADVSDKRAIVALAGRVMASLGGVDLLVHNASTLGPTPLRPLADLDCEAFSQVLETNLLGPFRLTKALIGPMIAQGSGLVVHISSDAAVQAYPTWGPYSVSKAGLDHLARIWAAELAQTGVSSVAIDPGEMDTAMHAAALPDADPAALTAPREVAESIAAQLARWSDDAPLEAHRLAVAGQRLEVA